MKLRNSMKAIIIRDGKVLLQKNEDELGLFYLLPGGGMNAEETLHEALQRECKEEIGTEVSIGELRFIRDYIGSHHEFAESDSDVHQIEFMFECTLPDGYEPQFGHIPDDRQIAVEWIPLNELHTIPLYPAVLKSLLPDIRANSQVYLGDVN